MQEKFTLNENQDTKNTGNGNKQEDFQVRGATEIHSDWNSSDKRDQQS
jgi:hypothetical protein